MSSDGDFFLDCFLDTHFSLLFWIFLDFCPKRVPKWTTILRRNGTHFRQIPPKWQKWAPRGPKASQKTPKWSPRVPKWSPKASQIEVLGLKTVVKKGREFRPFRRSTTRTTQRNACCICYRTFAITGELSTRKRHFSSMPQTLTTGD